MVAAPLVALCALLALCAGVAQAEAPKLVSYGNFGSGTTFSNGVAVDQSTSDLYVASLINTSGGNLNPGHVDKFDASLPPKLLAPSPFGEAFHSGAAVNPINGDVYVLGEAELFGSPSVDTYDPNTGALLPSFSVPASHNYSGLFTAVQIATDSAGDVYVPVVPENEVLEYDPSECPALPAPCALTPLKTFTGGSGAGALKEPTGVAVDASGDVWVADTTGKGRIEELGPTGAFIGEIKSEGVEAVALDTHGDVFAIVHNGADFCGSIAPPCSHLVEYSTAGVQVADIGAGSFGVAAGATVPNMLAVNDSSGRVYVTDGAKNLVWIFGPPSAPVLGRELAAEVGTSEAKLGALINPGGIETSYRFEYGTTAAYGQTTPFPDGNVGQGVTPHTVWATASGLAPGTTYHYRVIATNELGTVVGADQTFTTETSAQASCPNEQLRGGFSQSLPDCRAYELVTPPNNTSAQPDPKLGLNPKADTRENHAAREGNRMSYWALNILPGSQTGGESYVATRGASDWSSEDVIPLQSYTVVECPFHGAEMPTYSADVSKGVLLDGGGGRASEGEGRGGCDAEGVEVVSGEPQGFKNLLLRDNTNGTYQLINVPPPGVTPADAHFDGASPDLSHVVFDEHARLTANAPPGVDDLYEWTGGVLSLVTVLPNGTPVVGSLAAGRDQVAGGHAVSADGSHVFFSAGGNLYVRLNGEHTVQVDESRGGSGPGGGGSFQDASADGSQVFFTDDASAGLTSDTAPSSGTNLYRYAGGQLTDLTPGSHAEVIGVSGVSEDGSYVYFLADGVLTGTEENSQHATAQAGQPNLYLRHGGATTFIATLDPGDNVLNGGARVSPNGAFLAFASQKGLTGYDNTNANGGFPAPEIFLYSAGAASNQLACASCNPSGEVPTAGGATMEAFPGAAPHYLSDSGRLFFDTAEALLPLDTNGQIDVYEYEGGQLHLISAGTSSSESVLLDASESGNDVFFLTRQKLVPQDTEEEARNIYDARVDGGFPAPSSPPPCTTADACRSVPSPPPLFPSAGVGTAAVFGEDNLSAPRPAPKKVTKKMVKCKRGFVRKHNKCVKQKKAKKAKRASNHRRPGR